MFPNISTLNCVVFSRVHATLQPPLSVGWPVGWSVGRLVGRLVGRRTGWLVGIRRGDLDPADIMSPPPPFKNFEGTPSVIRVF